MSKPGIQMTCPRCTAAFRAHDGHTIYPYCKRCMDIISPKWDKENLSTKGEGMKIHRVSLYDSSEGHEGYRFCSSAKEANEQCADYKRRSPTGFAVPSMDVIEVTPTKDGILDLLNKYASHADNG